MSKSAIEDYMEARVKRNEAKGSNEICEWLRVLISLGYSLLPEDDFCNKLRAAIETSFDDDKLQPGIVNMDINQDGNYTISGYESASTIVVRPEEAERGVTEYKDYLSNKQIGTLQKLESIIYKELIKHKIILKESLEPTGFSGETINE